MFPSPCFFSVASLIHEKLHPVGLNVKLKREVSREECRGGGVLFGRAPYGMRQVLLPLLLVLFVEENPN